MHRRPPERTFLFGIHPILEALEAAKPMQRVLFLKGKQTDEATRILKLCREQGVPAQAVPKERLDRVTLKNHQGVIAFTSPVEFQPLEEVVMGSFERGESPFVVALDGVTDVRNLGAIARTAECFAVTALVVPMGGTAPLNEDAIKSSAGALLRIPVCRVKSIPTALTTLTHLGLENIALSEKAQHDIRGWKPDGPCCLVLGDEHEGISTESLAQCATTLAIPMPGHTASLNVGVAAGIALFSLRTTRG
jgi:23S rRNA (guanosine2251-2'-O)-methyltransferase